MTGWGRKMKGRPRDQKGDVTSTRDLSHPPSYLRPVLGKLRRI